jgi:hypothetical protein
MELKDLVGEHNLDAVDFLVEKIKDWGDRLENCNVIRFRLDGVVYVAVENPDDGYRSSMRELKTAEALSMTNTFAPVRVVGRHRVNGRHGEEDDVLELVDLVTGEVVVEVGTSDVSDYYPGFVANFNPEAMAVNKVRS